MVEKCANYNCNRVAEYIAYKEGWNTLKIMCFHHACKYGRVLSMERFEKALDEEESLSVTFGGR